MKLLKQTLCVWVLIISSHTLFAQLAEPWTQHDFPRPKGDYEFRLGHGNSYEQAQQNLDLQLTREFGCNVQSRTTGLQHSDQNNADNEIDTQTTAFSLECEGVNVWCYQVKRYHDEQGNYYILYEISKKGDFKPYYPVYTLTEDYNKRRATAYSVIPGMAQLYKGSTGKGVFFISGHAVLIGGIVAMESLRASNESKIASARNMTLRQDYIKNVDNYTNIRNGLIAGTVALYAWNVIDGMVAKGKKQKYQLLSGVDMRIMPYASLNMSGMIMTIKF